jgi:threonine dehydrogenase-like Zn-dependent dehydrogenase
VRASIANSNLANSSVTIGSTACALGATAASITGVTSITAAAVVTDDDGFRVRDNSDNTKQLAFECSSIATGTTRTLTIPNQSGTIALVGGGTTEFLDNVFRVQDNADNTKELAFECSGISSSTTRTMTVPNENGTISTESFATAIAVALG